MNESAEAQIARLDERVKTLLQLLEKKESTESAMQQWMGSVDQILSQMNHRMENVEKSLATSAPTINEFIVLKHKVLGAGVLGKAIWVGGAAIIGFLYGAREQFFAFMTNRGGQ